MKEINTPSVTLLKKKKTKLFPSFSFIYDLYTFISYSELKALNVELQ